MRLDAPPGQKLASWTGHKLRPVDHLAIPVTDQERYIEPRVALLVFGAAVAAAAIATLPVLLRQPRRSREV
jgi:hypothetical protein